MTTSTSRTHTVPALVGCGFLLAACISEPVKLVPPSDQQFPAPTLETVEQIYLQLTSDVADRDNMDLNLSSSADLVESLASLESERRGTTDLSMANASRLVKRVSNQIDSALALDEEGARDP